MLGLHLTQTYEELKYIGAVKSKRHFSRAFLGHHWAYLRDVEQRDRGEFRVPAATVTRLKTRLHEVSQHLSPRLRSQVEHVISQINQHVSVMRVLRYGRLDR